MIDWTVSTNYAYYDCGSCVTKGCGCPLLVETHESRGGWALQGLRQVPCKVSIPSAAARTC